jgi:Ulp1 family protease
MMMSMVETNSSDKIIDYLLLPINDAELKHWYLVVADFVNRSLTVFDSLLPTDAMVKTLKFIPSLTAFLDYYNELVIIHRKVSAAVAVVAE